MLTFDEEVLRALGGVDPIEARFWSKVLIIDDDTSCWEWQGGRSTEGYGQFSLATAKRGKGMNASRVSWWLTNERPDEWPVIVCHKCDNPPCVRPSHLFEGDHAINMADSLIKGRRRTRQGSANPAAKLTEAQVIEIRNLRAQGVPFLDIQQRYNISESSAMGIASGNLWPHVGGPITNPIPRPIKLNAKIVKEIRERAATGETDTALAEEYNLSRTAITLAVRGRTWKDAGGPIGTGIRNRAKLTDEQRSEIIERRLSGEHYLDLAAEFGVSKETIFNIMKKARG